MELQQQQQRQRQRQQQQSQQKKTFRDRAQWSIIRTVTPFHSRKCDWWFMENFGGGGRVNRGIVAEMPIDGSIITEAKRRGFWSAHYKRHSSGRFISGPMATEKKNDVDILVFFSPLFFAPSAPCVPRSDGTLRFYYFHQDWRARKSIGLRRSAGKRVAVFFVVFFLVGPFLFRFFFTERSADG